MNEKSSSVSGMFLLFLVFLTLKLTEVIAWSWWWVTAPLWAPLAIALVLMIGALIISGIAAVVTR